MNILINIAHPAQFHLYKFVAKNLIDNGHIVHIVLNSNKEILLELLSGSGLPFVCLSSSKKRPKSILGRFFKLMLNDFRLIRFSYKNKIDLITGSTVEVAHVSWFLRIFSINTDDDDASVVPMYAATAGPFIQTSLAPMVCNNGFYEKKTIKYHGYHKLAYLHPKHFIPDINIAAKYVSLEKNYFILRFSSLDAHHDHGVRGINNDFAEKLINYLLPNGNVYISSERNLSNALEKYCLKINVMDIHHVMAYATILISDSQSMSHEAAMLGVPSIRYNDFAGRISVLEELENKYHLTFAISPDQPESVFIRISELLSYPILYDEFQYRRQLMLNDKIDVTSFFTWFIENYPRSKQIMKENPDYQYNFK